MKILKKHWEIITLFLLSFLVSWPLLMSGYFSHHDDLHVMRIFEMRQCFADLQIPCRWIPDMGWGNGFPLFNYYSAFPYYLGALLSFFVGYIGAAKMLFFIPLVLGVYPVYLIGSEIFSKRIGFLSGVLYMFAPYRALDLYVRGAVAESFGMSLAPLIMYFVLKLVTTGKYRYSIGVSLSLAAFLTSHNIMTLFFSWVIAIWVIGLLLYFKFKTFFMMSLSLLTGFLISSFFIIPAFLEKNLVNTDNLTVADLNFRANFVSIYQLFMDRNWGYGASVLGTGDTISFQIGWPLWWLSLISVIIIPLVFILKKKIVIKNLDLETINNKTMLYWFFFTTVFLSSIIMMHGKSSFIWEHLLLLQYAQFPWRFLSLTIFAGAILSVFWLTVMKSKFQNYLIIFLAGLTIVLNVFYFRPERFFYDMTDQKKLSGTEWETQRKASLLDYLPQKSLIPREPAQKKPFTRSGKADISDFQNHSNNFKFSVVVSKKSLVEVPIFDFPNWEVYANGKKLKIDNNNYLARISFILPAGEYEIHGILKNTLIRQIGNGLTLFGFILLLITLFYGKSKKTL